MNIKTEFERLFQMYGPPVKAPIPRKSNAGKCKNYNPRNLKKKKQS